MDKKADAEMWEQERRNAINQMKCLKRAEKAESVAQLRLANEKMELDVLTSAMLFAEVAHKTGSIDHITKVAVQAEIIADFRQKRKLDTEVYTLTPEGTPVMNFMQLFASALINNLLSLPHYGSVTGCMLFYAYREFGMPFAIPPPRPEPLSGYEKISNVLTSATKKTMTKLEIRIAQLRGGDLKVQTQEKDFLRLFLTEVAGVQCILFDKRCHRPTLYDLNPVLMRQKLTEKGCYDDEVMLSTRLVFEHK